MSKVYVTGMGIISPIGNNAAENRAALAAGKSGLSHIELFDSKFANAMPFGEIKISNQELKLQLGVTDKGVTRTTLLALYAAKQAIADSGLSQEELSSFDTALISATTVGGMCHTNELFADANVSETPSEYISSYELGTVNLYLEKHLGIVGTSAMYNTACSSSANAIMMGARMIKYGYAKRVLVGGVDSLAKFTINGFNSLNILSSELTTPFDANRKGLNLGEGAAFLVLEGEEEAKGKTKYAEVSGYANTNDAFHPSSLSDNGEGPYLAMSKALEMAHLKPEQIGFINTHGTATENNDEVEGKAMQRVFGTPPVFASTKANTGHTLAAAGSIEAVFCILNLQNQEIYPNLRFKEAVPATGLEPVKEYAHKELNHVMSNSFGFGGNCSSVIFSRV